MNTEFKNYVTNTAFNLTLSKGMCKTLIAEKTGNKKIMYEDGKFLMHLQALQRRGLVIHDPTVKPMSNDSAWSLTHAGELVYQLLVESALTK